MQILVSIENAQKWAAENAAKMDFDYMKDDSESNEVIIWPLSDLQSPQDLLDLLHMHKIQAEFC